nr:myosin-binding protein 3 isoform X2 [Arachis hypogaea]
MYSLTSFLLSIALSFPFPHFSLFSHSLPHSSVTHTYAKETTKLRKIGNKTKKQKPSMAANKFASMLHRNTNKIVVILVYAVLEWILIVLLLLNSLFSYLISRFAKCVGLQPPCLWCSRVDHILQHGKSGNLDKDLVCESHAAEISKLGYCSNHKKLAETQHMCEDCLASRPNRHENSVGIGHNRIAFISWISHENGDDDDTKRCSCCNESLRRELYPPYLLLKPSWGDARKGSFIVESIHDEKEADKDIEFEINNGEEEEEDHDDVHQILSDIESFILREVAEDRSSSVSNLHSDEKEGEKDDLIIITKLDPNGSINCWEDRSIEVIDRHFKNNVECETNRLIPVEFIDSITSLPFEPCKIDELERFDITESSLENSIVFEFEELKQDSVAKVHREKFFTFEEAQTSSNEDNNVEAVSEEQNNTRVDLPISEEPLCSYGSSHEDESSMDDESSTSDDDDDVGNAFEKFIAQNNLSKSQILSNGDNDIEDDMEESHKNPTEQEFSCQCIAEDESSESEDDTGVANAFDEFISQNNLCLDKGEKDNDYAEMIVNDDGVDNAFDKFISQNNLCSDKEAAKDNDYAEMIEKTNSAEKNHEETSHQSCEADEDKLPETPSSVNGLQYAHRKLMQRELGAEDSMDGSVASELEYGDPISTIDNLKTALKSERKALSAIYQELEEERSASAVAANQTMAMITRLQEEKAAMRMEALQYQRMMEEQAEYDQEALQLLNELMLKREKEKQELEKELEEYRQKVVDYEAKEKIRLLRRMKDGTTRSRDSSSSSDISIDLNREVRDKEEEEEEEDNLNNKATTADGVSNLEEMALDCVKHISVLDDSLAEFEEERALILDQLRELEEKIMNLEESEEFIDDIEITEHSSTHCDKELNENCSNYSSPEENMHNFSDDKQNIQRRTMGSLAKRLLPYLDAAENENEEEAYTLDHTQIMKPESVEDVQDSVGAIEKVSVEEEVDRVYERLQALESDREFLQNCVGSIQNGDKGTGLLQEILQHLRDLKAVEHRLKNLGTDPLM